MPVDFDPGYRAPYDQLCRESPDETVYPAKDFGIKWGPVFHRGRLDGTARVPAIGQDPAPIENIVRRSLPGTAAHRFQGFRAKMGIDRSYVMINTFLYSIYGQSGGSKHHRDAAVEIPELDVPPGTPPRMRTAADWSKRKGSSPAIRRATIVVTGPFAFQN